MSNISEEKCRIGIMGGSFDPIHYGHLNLAEQIRQEFKLDVIYFVPVGDAPHKVDSKMTNKNLRYEMTQNAIENNIFFKISSIEIESNEKSYTINTIKKLREIFKENIELFFITGADAIIELEHWKSFEELLKLVTFITAIRPGVTNQELVSKIQFLVKKYNAHIELTEVPALAISSTDIRTRVKNKKSIKYLVPDKVEQLIYNNGLYLE